MAKLILIKHAAPQIEPDTPSPRWVLSVAGRARCGWLAETLAAEGVQRLYASLEPKALETAALVGVQLGLEVRPREDLHENDRAGLGFGPIEALHQRIQAFFAAPSALVMGRETADAALTRFESAVRALASEAPDETAAVVTHGTVLTLLVARHNPIEPFAFWSALSLPACVLVDSADFRLLGPVRNFPADATHGAG